MEEQGGVNSLSKERRDILEDLWRAYREEKRVWRQKSRVRWLKEGDRNTKYFHRICKARTVRKSITQLRYQGRELTAPAEIKATLRNHFQNFFRVADVIRPRLQNENLQKVSDSKNQLLEAAFSQNEIWEVVKSFDGNRAPGPNDSQEEISDYRPISLIGSVYKLLSKVLSIRLSLVLPRLLTPNQFAFTAGRQISDCSLIAAEIVHSISVRPHGASLAVLVNGSPSKFFSIEEGLRQGDPLSPLLFNIVANGMSCMLNQLLAQDIPCGVEVAPGLKINFKKSEVFGVNAPLEVVQEVANWWNFKRELISFSLDKLANKNLSRPLADICAVWREIGMVGNVFREGIAVQVGRGSSVLFWLDHWAGSGPFRLVFPRVFALASHKRATVMDCGVVDGHKWVWDLSFVREFLGWERQQYDDFLIVLQQMVAKQGLYAEVDCKVWKHDNMGIFSVKSVQKNRIATKENLLRRGVAFEDGTTCVLCSTFAELVAHLFLHCPKVWQMWVNVLHREEEVWESHMFRLFTWIKAWWKDCPYGADQFARSFTRIDIQGKQGVRPIVPWKPPQGKILKFNVDGSFQSGGAGVGGILRNGVGVVIGKFSRKVQVQRADEAEVLAILYALLFYQ
ncbi:uncharacterized protein LOC130736373 [Lotus japonicus]|uniref:uncharacterized protein LOC130736373 n=1 Tax=Lotus japonicus TaxID=34305 RepID=UPI00258427E3|nr:uncharacterized protein LOC130736373 [Lotus japonicus]